MLTVIDSHARVLCYGSMRKRRYEIADHSKLIQITEKRLDVLLLLARYRYLRSSFIFPLLPQHGRRGLQTRLTELHRAGYIEKPKAQLANGNNLYCHDIYALTEKGERELAYRGHVPERVTQLFKAKGGKQPQNFDHAMMICDTLASIEIETLGNLIPWTEVVERAQQDEPLSLPASIRYQGETNDRAIRPDGFLGLRRGDGKVAFFAVECENASPARRHTIKENSFLRKALAYREIAKTGVYKEKLGIPNLRVLVTSPTQAKTKAQQKLVEEVIGPSNLFLFRTIPSQRITYKPTKPLPLVSEPWERAGMEPIKLLD